MKKRGFTLLEIMIAIIGFSLLMVVIIGMYQKFILIKYNAQARSNLIERSYFALEKINLILKDYTIDYEEYFNRQNVGCNGIQTTFSRNVSTGGYCPNFTAYGNRNNVFSNTGLFMLYYCSSVTSESSPNVVRQNANIVNGSGCAKTGSQSFGNYKLQFLDVQKDVDSITGSVGDDDDINMGKGPDAILISTGIQELYLISQDKTHRILLRRYLVESGNRDGKGVGSGDTNNLYTIQMLKLRGFDAGNQHNFNTVINTGLYDGVIDTWACDYAQGFICAGSGVGGAYTGFNLPLHRDDGRVNLFDRNITISDRNIKIFPTKDPDLAWNEDNFQINPYFTMSMTSKLYGGVWFNRLKLPSLDAFQFSLQTTFNTKNFYTK